MAKWMERVAGGAATGVAGCLVFGALLAVWQRALDALAGRTEYSLLAFWLALAVGVAAGYALAWLLCRRVRQPAALLWVVFLASACWLVFLLAVVSGIVGGWQRLLADASRTFGLYALTLGKTAAFFIFVPACLAGAGLRVALLKRQSPQAPALLTLFVGVAAALLGYVAAAASASAVSVEAFTRLAALWFGALASLAVLAGGERRTVGRAAWAAATFAWVVIALMTLRPGEGASVLCDGMFSRLVNRDSGFAQGKPIFEHQSRCHSVAAYADTDYQFVFTLDGRPVLFGNRFHTARTLTGYVPLLVRPGCKRAAVLGAEAGLYLPFFARAGVADIGYAEADPAVVKLAVAADAYMTGDGTCEKAALHQDVSLTPKGAYDILFLTAEPVWMRGVGARYGKPWFECCRQALSADGIVALHLDARALSPERFAAIASCFSGVFPGVQVWCTGPYDWVLVGGAKAIKTPVDGMLALFERTPVFRDFVRAGGLALSEALACMLCDGKGLGPWLANAGRESARQAEWLAPCRLFEKGGFALQPVTLEGCRQWKAQWILPGETDVDLYLALVDKVGRNIGGCVAAVTALAEMAKGRSETGLGAARDAAAISPHAALLMHLSDSLDLEGRRRIKIGDLKGALKCFENLLSFSAGTAFSHYGLGYCLRGNGDNAGAYLHFSRAVAYAPEQADFRLEMAQSALAVGEYAEADRQYQEVLKREPDNPVVLFLAAKGLAWHERPQKDMAKALKLAERACELTKWENREYAFGLADLYMDAGKVLEGMGLKRRLKEGGNAKAPLRP